MKLTPKSKTLLKGVHPDLVRVVTRCVSDWTDSTLSFVITCGVRTIEEQRVLVKNRKSTTMRSRHIPAKNGFSHAIDVAAIVGGKVNWELPNYARIAKRMKAAAKAENVPLEWGGEWSSLVDGPHFQLPWAQYPGTK